MKKLNVPRGLINWEHSGAGDSALTPHPQCTRTAWHLTSEDVSTPGPRNAASSSTSYPHPAPQHMHAHVCVHTYTHAQTCTYACMHTCRHVHTPCTPHTCAHTRTDMHTNAYTHAHSLVMFSGLKFHNQRHFLLS